MRSAHLRVLDMLQALRNIERHATQGKRRFETDEVLQGYIVYQLMILGEAAFSMPADVRARYAEVPWKKVGATRQLCTKHSQ